MCSWYPVSLASARSLKMIRIAEFLFCFFSITLRLTGNCGSALKMKFKLFINIPWFMMDCVQAPSFCLIHGALCRIQEFSVQECWCLQVSDFWMQSITVLRGCLPVSPCEMGVSFLISSNDVRCLCLFDHLLFHLLFLHI